MAPDHGAKGVRTSELVTRHELWQQRRLGRTEQGAGRAVEGNQQHDRDELALGIQGNRRQGRDGDSAACVRDHHRPTPLEAIAENPARDRHQETGNEEGDADHGQRGRRAVGLVNAPGQRHPENAVADLRDRLATYKKEEVSVA